VNDDRRRPLRVVVAAVVLGVLAVAGTAPAAIGYIGQAPVQISLSGPPGAVSCGDTVTITATVIGTASGDPVDQQVVQWKLTERVSKQDALSGSSSTTDAAGQASIQLSFGDAPGAREVTAEVTIVKTPIQVMCGDGLPQTSLERPGAVGVPGPSDSLVAPASDPSASAVLPARAISVPRLGIVAPIVEGDGVDVPADAVAHYPGTAWPGQGSNTYLYGHARTGLFRELWQVRTGDLVEVRLADGVIERYQVTRILPLVPWDDLSQLDPTPSERLTLQTCLWYDETSPRLVVIAEPLAGA
jgi:LPXTG-site transpeptidase (sortase) family protein